MVAFLNYVVLQPVILSNFYFHLFKIEEALSLDQSHKNNKCILQGWGFPQNILTAKSFMQESIMSVIQAHSNVAFRRTEMSGLLSHFLPDEMPRTCALCSKAMQQSPSLGTGRSPYCSPSSSHRLCHTQFIMKAVSLVWMSDPNNKIWISNHSSEFQQFLIGDSELTIMTGLGYIIQSQKPKEQWPPQT